MNGRQRRTTNDKRPQTKNNGRRTTTTTTTAMTIFSAIDDVLWQCVCGLVESPRSLRLRFDPLHSATLRATACGLVESPHSLRLRFDPLHSATPRATADRRNTTRCRGGQWGRESSPTEGPEETHSDASPPPRRHRSQRGPLVAALRPAAAAAAPATTAAAAAVATGCCCCGCDRLRPRPRLRRFIRNRHRFDEALWLEPPAFEGLTRLALRGTRLGDAGAEALADLLAPPEAAGAHGALVQARGVAWRVAWHVVMSHDAGATSRDVARLGAARSSRHRRLARFDREQSRRP